MSALEALLEKFSGLNWKETLIALAGGCLLLKVCGGELLLLLLFFWILSRC